MQVSGLTSTQSSNWPVCVRQAAAARMDDDSDRYVAAQPFDDSPTCGPIKAATTEGATRNELFGRLFAFPGRPAPSDAVKAHITQRLAHVPTEVLQVVCKAGEHIAVLRKDETLAASGVLSEVDLPKAYDDMPALARIAQAAFERSHNEHDGDISKLENKTDRTAQENSALFDLKVNRSNDAWREIWDRSGGRLDRGFANCGLDDKTYNELLNRPVTLEEIARQHGAQTPQEIDDYAARTAALNVDTLKRLQGDGHADLPISQRPFTIGEAELVVPSYHFYREDGCTHVFAGAEVKFSLASIANWANNVTKAQHFVRERAIVFREDRMDADADRVDTVEHEFGHAFQAALRAADPAWFADFDRRWQETYGQNKSNNSFTVPHSSSNAEEYFADAFALRYQGREAELESKDPAGNKLMTEALNKVTANCKNSSPIVINDFHQA